MINSTLFDLINSTKHVLHDYLRTREYNPNSVTNVNNDLDEDTAGYVRVRVPFDLLKEKILDANNNTIAVDDDKSGFLLYLKGKQYPKFVPDYERAKEIPL